MHIRANANRAPTAGNINNRSVTAEQNLAFNIAGVFRDADGDDLTYGVSCASPNIAKGVGVRGTEVTINGRFAGGTQCTVSADDGSGVSNLQKSNSNNLPVGINPGGCAVVALLV